jgi:hypothetical protein
VTFLSGMCNLRPEKRGELKTRDEKTICLPSSTNVTLVSMANVNPYYRRNAISECVLKDGFGMAILVTTLSISPLHRFAHLLSSVLRLCLSKEKCSA